MKIDKFYCINLDKRPEKWDRFSEMIDGKIDVERFPGIDGSLWTEDEWMYLSANSRKKNENIARGHLACAHSHMKIHQDAIDKDYDIICVFEDDCYIKVDDLLKEIDLLENELPDDWSVFFIGGKPYKINRRQPLYEYVSDNILRALQIYETHAYIARVKKSSNELIHLWGSGLDADKATVEWQNVSRTCYLSNPILCSQLPGHSDIRHEHTKYHGEYGYKKLQKIVIKEDKKSLF